MHSIMVSFGEPCLGGFSS